MCRMCDTVDNRCSPIMQLLKKIAFKTYLTFYVIFHVQVLFNLKNQKEHG